MVQSATPGNCGNTFKAVEALSILEGFLIGLCGILWAAAEDLMRYSMRRWNMFVLVRSSPVPGFAARSVPASNDVDLTFRLPYHL